MRKVFKNHSEVCHIWASRSQDEGTAGNISFSENVIYSYHWWPMANFINDNTVLVVDHSYSSSTSQHMGYVRSAIPDYYNIIRVKQPAKSHRYGGIDHGVNIEGFKESIKADFIAFPKSRKYKPSILRGQQGKIASLAEYCKLFGLYCPSVKKYDLNKPEYIQQAEKQAQDLVEIEAKKQAEREALILRYSGDRKLLEADWLSGVSDKTRFYVDSIGYLHIETTRLRVRNDTIETSMGANVPIKEAKILYLMIKAGKDIKGHKIGPYTVIGINGELQIGCHKIERDEIERIARIMSW